MSTDGLELDGRLDVPAGWNCSVFPVESQDSMSAPVLEIDKDDDGQHGGGGPRGEMSTDGVELNGHEGVAEPAGV